MPKIIDRMRMMDSITILSMGEILAGGARGVNGTVGPITKGPSLDRPFPQRRNDAGDHYTTNHPSPISGSSTPINTPARSDTAATVASIAPGGWSMPCGTDSTALRHGGHR